MESRRGVRVAIDKAIVLTVLGEPEVRLAAHVKDASPHGLGMVAAGPVCPGMPVKIETDDEIVLGEAVYCRPMEEGWFIGIRYRQVLTGLAALSRKAREFQEALHPAAAR